MVKLPLALIVFAPVITCEVAVINPAVEREAFGIFTIFLICPEPVIDWIEYSELVLLFSLISARYVFWILCPDSSFEAFVAVSALPFKSPVKEVAWTILGKKN